MKYPTDTYLDLGTTTSYTAPSNGILFAIANGNSTDNVNHFCQIALSNGMSTRNQASASANTPVNAWIPIRAGQTATISVSNASLVNVRLYT
jgi:hypothetical protein